MPRRHRSNRKRYAVPRRRHDTTSTETQPTTFNKDSALQRRHGVAEDNSRTICVL